MSKAIKAGAWYTMSDLFLRGLSIITAPIFTRLLSTSDYGIASNFSSWQNILACILGLCLSYSVGRAKIDFKDDFDGYLSSILGLSSLFSVFIFICAWPFLDTISKFMVIDKPLLISLFVLLTVNPSIEYLRTKFRFEYKYKENIYISVISAFSEIALSIGLILLCDNSSKYVGKIMGAVIPAIIISIICYTMVLKKGRKIFVKRYWKYALTYSLPMIPHGLSMIVLSQMDRIMIIKMVGESEAGIYSFGYSYSIIISTITNAILNAWQPWLYENIHDGNVHKITHSDRLLNLSGCMLALFFVTVAPEVIMVLGSKAFWAAKWMVMPVIIGTLYQFFYSKYALVELYSKKTYLIAIGSILAAFANYILNLIFIPKYGYIAAAYTTLVGYFLLMLFHWIIIYFVIKIKIFDNKQIWLIGLITFALSIFMMLLYNTILFRYILFILLLIIYLFFYKEFVKSIIIKCINNIKNKNIWN